jgi:hypothetical protein
MDTILQIAQRNGYHYSITNQLNKQIMNTKRILAQDNIQKNTR